MRLHGLLCWYDEPVENLVACVTSLHEAGVDHVVAVDGRFAQYGPDLPANSHPNQHAAIVLACLELGMACTLYAPAEPFASEPAKRTALFALAASVADDGDWFWVQDADMVVTRWPDDLKQRLAATDRVTAEVEVLDVVAQRAERLDWPARFAFRGLYRAQRITVGPSHCTYVGEDGVPLWNGAGMKAEAEALDLTAVVEVEHRPDRRPHERQAAKMQHYAVRDASGIERGSCAHCDRKAVRFVASQWKRSRIGPISKWVEVCEDCAQRLEKVSRVRLRQMGVDPDSARIENRNGRIPSGMSA
jgi:hypothetical protein